MKDTMSTSASSKRKVWATFGIAGTVLAEYDSMEDFRSNTITTEHYLDEYPYFGTGHVVYAGSFYYHWVNRPSIIRYDIARGEIAGVLTIPDVVFAPNASMSWQGYLYRSRTMFIDFSADENGLWVIYGNGTSGKVQVSLLDVDRMAIVDSVPVDVRLGSRGNAFVVCGRLYTLRHHNRRKSYLDKEFDLWLNETKRMRMAFANPSASTNMVKFNSRDVQLLVWGDGKQMVSPMLLHYQQNLT